VCPDDTIRCFCSGGGVLPEDLSIPLIIEDNNPADLTRILDFTNHASILDLVVQFEIDHPFIGDLVMTLTHGNTTVLLVDRPGRTGGEPGCDADLSCTRRIFLGDAAPVPIECGSPTQCATCFPGGEVQEAFYAPNQPLGAFAGQDAFGPWRFSIADHAPGNVGALCGWSLSIRTEGTTAVEPATWGMIKTVYD
jgi:subtilisin-like proprotein convertase family protein